MVFPPSHQRPWCTVIPRFVGKTREQFEHDTTIVYSHGHKKLDAQIFFAIPLLFNIFYFLFLHVKLDKFLKIMHIVYV